MTTRFLQVGGPKAALKMLTPPFLWQAAHAVKSCVAKPEPKVQYAEIGRYRIRLPENGRLLIHKKAFHLYDTALVEISRVLYGKYPGLHAIDIGANVGDTAALIRKSAEIPVLCIEGDPALLPLLSENVARLGPGVEMEESFVGLDGAAVNLNFAHDLGSNACLVEAADAQGPTKLRSLRAILTDHPEFARSKLLKIDTEGFDFDIIRQSLEFIQHATPAIFFEYAPYLRPDESHAGLGAIEALVRAGYSDFIYYDNFGNFLLRTDAANRDIFRDLDAYLASNRRHGVAVCYFDVCALHQEDADLVRGIRSLTQR
jgi:FkbM family methyltransferase